MNISDLTFVAPGFSVQDLSFRNTLTAPMGKVFPVLFEYVEPGNVAELDWSWFNRTFPLLSPLMDTMEITFDGFWVPARVLSHSGGKSIEFDYESYFNPRNINSNVDGPKIALTTLVNLTLQRYGRLTSTLYDYLGYPLFPKFFEEFGKMLSNLRLNDSESVHEGAYLWNQFDVNAPIFVNQVVNDETAQLNISGSTISGDDYDDAVPVYTVSGDSYMHPDFMDFSSYVCLLYGKFLAGLNSYLPTIAHASNAANLLKEYDDPLGRVCQVLNTNPSQLYEDWLCTQYRYINSSDDHYNRYLYLLDRSTMLELCGDIANHALQVSFTPFIVYWKIIFDWYISPLQYDGDFEYINYINQFLDDGSMDGISGHQFNLLDLADRLYEFDRFVSATNGSDQPNVMLPVSPSVKDIRSANRVQLMLERVLKTGKRYVDQILTTFGVQPSDSRVDRSEVLFRRESFLDIQSVTQTNQSSLNAAQAQPLGWQVGQSATFQSFAGGTFQFDEHGYFLVLCSIRPKPTYFQGVNPFLTKLKASEFLIPDFAQIGDDVITKKEIYFDYGASARNDDGTDKPFANQQRYYEYMSHLNEVHGHMSSDLRYYHLARYFSASPVYNKNFVSVNVQQNDLARIWATYDESPFMMFIDFRFKMLRALPEGTTYSL